MGRILAYSGAKGGVGTTTIAINAAIALQNMGRRVCLVAVDAPSLPGLFPRLDVVTHPEFFYVRFHGRNDRGWRSGNKQKQFDYDYTDAELREWAEGPIRRMAEQAAAGFVFFNNHVRGQAPRNAVQFVRLLAG